MKDKTVLLHVGYPKTATSALQAFFMLNKKALADQGVLYPAAGSTDYSGHIAFFHAIKRKQYSVFKELLKEISKFHGDKVLLSSEYFFALEDHEITELLSHLSDFKVKIVAYVRRVDERVESGFIQVVRDSERRFSGDVWDYLEFLKKNPQRIDYELFDQLWCKHVGAENVVIRLYGKSVDVYSDFTSVLGLGGALTQFELPDKTINDRIPRILFDTLRLINSFIADKYEHQEVLSQLLNIVENDSTINKNKFSVLTRAERVRISEMYEGQCTYICEKYGLNHNELLGTNHAACNMDNVDTDYREVASLLYRLWRTNKHVNFRGLLVAFKRFLYKHGRS